MTSILQNLQDVLHDEKRFIKISRDRLIAFLLPVHERRSDIAHKSSVLRYAGLRVFFKAMRRDPERWHAAAKRVVNAHEVLLFQHFDSGASSPASLLFHAKCWTWPLPRPSIGWRKGTGPDQCRSAPAQWVWQPRRHRQQADEVAASRVFANRHRCYPGRWGNTARRGGCCRQPITDAERLTRFGRFLRASSLDELSEACRAYPLRIKYFIHAFRIDGAIKPRFDFDRRCVGNSG